jgi:hypothetical protein
MGCCTGDVASHPLLIMPQCDHRINYERPFAREDRLPKAQCSLELRPAGVRAQRITGCHAQKGTTWFSSDAQGGLFLLYQINFTPNCIWREEVTVRARTPAFTSFAPEASKIELLASFKKLGAAKLGWFKRLNTSARN